MNKITVSKTTVLTMGEYGPDSYEALNLRGHGEMVATISGMIKPIIDSKDDFGADMIDLDGVVWCIRDVIAMAKRGDNGLTIE